MTIEEAIQHCKEVAMENRRSALEFARVNVYDTARNCQKCAAEHEQLAEWLSELKRRRDAEISAHPKTNADCIRQMTDEELVEFLMNADANICDFCDMKYPENCLSHSCEGEDCKTEILKWLKQEVNTDDER